MADAVTFVHVEIGGSFGFHAAGGELVLITDKPTSVDASHAAYLDTVPHVKRAGKAKPEPSGGEEG